MTYEEMKQKLGEKIEEAKFKAKVKTMEACDQAKVFYRDHEAEIRKWAPIVASGTIATVRVAYRNHKRHAETIDLKCRHWDPRLGEYYWSKRPLRTGEKLKLDDLYSRGYSKGEALRTMGLLRY